MKRYLIITYGHTLYQTDYLTHEDFTGNDIYLVVDTKTGKSMSGDGDFIISENWWKIEDFGY